MRLLLDTHFIVWLTVSPGSLTSKELALLQRADVDVAASAISLWELRLKWNSRSASGNRKGPGEPEDMLAALTAADIPVLSLSAEQACMALAIPVPHKDPFDEQLLIQAQQTGRQLLTRDRLILTHPLAISAP